MILGVRRGVLDTFYVLLIVRCSLALIICASVHTYYTGKAWNTTMIQTCYLLHRLFSGHGTCCAFFKLEVFLAFDAIANLMV